MEKQNLEFLVKDVAGFIAAQGTHIGTVEGARLKAVKEAKDTVPEWETGKGPTIIVRDKLSRQVYEEFPL